MQKKSFFCTQVKAVGTAVLAAARFKARAAAAAKARAAAARARAETAAPGPRGASVPMACLHQNSSSHRRIFQLSTYHELQLEEISGLVHFFFLEVEVRFSNSIFKFAEAEWGVSRSPAGCAQPAAAGEVLPRIETSTF